MLPACALAGYHLILFGIGVIRSDSIQLLESELVKGTTNVVKREYDGLKIGSKGETAWTDFKVASTAMRITSGVAFLVPYLSALLLTAYCLYRIYRIDMFTPWPVKCAVGLYGAVLVTLVYFGSRIISRGRGLPGGPEIRQGRKAAGFRLRPRWAGPGSGPGPGPARPALATSERQDGARRSTLRGGPPPRRPRVAAQKHSPESPAGESGICERVGCDATGAGSQLEVWARCRQRR
jgi:hypothetical protein